ncbi:MAG: translation initiation factor IF-3 [Opitutales bacterium]|nr:translation initiation factor IF-3 [Opitutales bacterium]
MANYPGSRGRGRYHRSPQFQVRKNERIRAREVRLIGHDGNQIGVVSRDDALSAAKKMGLDLVEIAANARPPVCRILDFGKYMYEQSKRQKENKAKAASSSKIKEVKFRVRIEEHDYMTKLRRAEEFLYKGNKLKLSLMFRGRENEHKELGVEMLKRAANDLVHVGSSDADPKLSGRHVNLIMSPHSANKRTLKYNEHVNVGGADDDDDEEEDDED